MKFLITTLLIFVLAQTTFASESKENRVNKKIYTALSPFGFSSNGLSSGIEVGHYISGQQIISINANVTYNIGVRDRDDDDSLSSSERDEEAEDRAELRSGQGYNVGINYKQFFGNSFYIKPGVYYKSQYIVDDIELDDDSEVTSTVEGNYKVAGLSFKIGQSWHWDSFLIGCDWFGLARSFALFERTGNLNDDELFEATLLNFYVGMSF